MANRMNDRSKPEPRPPLAAPQLEEGLTRDELLKHMHGIAAGYHQHYSTVRTTATALVMPLGFIASITMLTLCQDLTDGRFWAMALVGFVVVVTTFLNLIFAQWSAIARRAERFYEEELQAGRARPGETQIGFRHLFSQLARPAGDARGGTADRETWLGHVRRALLGAAPRKPRPRLAPIGRFSRSTLRDPFLRAAILGWPSLPATPSLRIRLVARRRSN